ncbi:MAG: hypothetical protein ACLS4Z_05510 [Christensenellaceae bacterium]
MVFYIGVNFNSILLAFQKYDQIQGKYEMWGLNNFKAFINDLIYEPLMMISLKNSLTLYFVGLLIGTPLTILISFAYSRKYLRRRIPRGSIFAVDYFFHSICADIQILYRLRVFRNHGWLKISDFPRLLSDPKYASVRLFLRIMDRIRLGRNFVFHVMTRIPISLMEYGKLEGLNAMQELFLVVIPMIFPTLTTFW